MEQQQQQQEQERDTASAADKEDLGRLTGEIESRLLEYLAKAGQEYPPGCQADWLAGTVAERLLGGGQPDGDGEAEAQPSRESLVKLCIYLMENLSDVSTAYEDFYSQQLAALRDEGASAHAQVAALDDENGRLREQLHQRAEELRNCQAAVESFRARNLGLAAAATTGGGHQFDEAVSIESDEEEGEEGGGEGTDSRGGGCPGCAQLREAVGRLESESARMAALAAKNAAMKADLEDWEADMAEKVRQNVELSAQLEACQRLLGRLGQASMPAVVAATASAASRSIFGGVPLLRRK